MRMLVNGFAYAYKYFKEAETERTGSPYFCFRKEDLYNWKGSFAFFLWTWKKKRQTNTTDTNLNKEIRYIPGVEWMKMCWTAIKI